MNRESHLKEIVRGGSASFINQVIGIGAGYVFTLLVTRKFGAEALGIYAITFTVLRILSVPGKLGFEVTLLRFVSDYASRDKWGLVKDVYLKTATTAFLVSLLLSALFFLFSRQVAVGVFHKEHLGFYFEVISLFLLPFVFISLNSECIRGLKRIKESSFLKNALMPTTSVVALMLLFYFANTQYAPVLALAAAITVSCAFSFYWWLKDSRLADVARTEGIGMKEILNVSMPALMAGSLFLIMQWVDTIILAMFRTEYEVGIYNVALKVSTITTVSMVAINNITGPKISELYGRGDMAGIEKVARQSAKLNVWTTLPVVIVIFTLPSYILGIFGDEFKAGVYALVFLAVGQLVNAFCGPVEYVLLMTGRQRVYQNIVFGATILNVVLNVLLIPEYGMVGSAFASMTSVILWNLASVYYVKQKMQIGVVHIPFMKPGKA